MRKETKELFLNLGIYIGVGAAIGAIGGFGLSFTTLSPLTLGRILGSAVPALFTIIVLGISLYNFYTQKKNLDQDKEMLILGSIFSLASAIIGGIIVTSYLPGVVGMWSTALAGAVIVVVSPLLVATALIIGIEFTTQLEYQKRKVLGGAVIGASTVFALSFAVALSPLVIGGIVGAISGILFAGSSMLWGKSTQDRINFCVSMHSLGAVTGIGLGATANAVFPGVMLSIGPAILAGAVIGAIAPVLGLFAVEKANSYIISPVVEKVTECFSSRKNQSNMTYSWN